MPKISIFWLFNQMLKWVQLGKYFSSVIKVPNQLTLKYGHYLDGLTQSSEKSRGFSLAGY